MNIRSRKDVDFDDVVWEKGKGDIGQIQFNIGRYMPLTDKWVAIPRVGVGFTVIEPFYNKDLLNKSGIYFLGEKLFF